MAPIALFTTLLGMQTEGEIKSTHMRENRVCLLGMRNLPVFANAIKVRRGYVEHINAVSTERNRGNVRARLSCRSIARALPRHAVTRRFHVISIDYVSEKHIASVVCSVAE